MGMFAKLKSWWGATPRDLSPESLEEIEIELPDPTRCNHDLVIANARVTQEDGMAIYVLMLIECSLCKDTWRLQHRVNELSQITGAHERFLTPRQLGLEVHGEGGSIVKNDDVEDTMAILNANRAKGQRTYSPYRPAPKQKKAKKCPTPKSKSTGRG